jgi:hypothetical protein
MASSDAVNLSIQHHPIGMVLFGEIRRGGDMQRGKLERPQKETDSPKSQRHPENATVVSTNLSR